MREIRRILFIRTDRIGDTLANLPAIRLLRQTYPKAWIALLVHHSIAPLLRGHPDIDEVMTLDPGRFKKAFRYRGDLWASVRRARFDTAFVSNPEKRLHALVFLAGIPVRVGYRRKWGFLLTHTIKDHKHIGLHEIDYNLKLVKLLSPLEWDGAVALPPNTAADASIQALLRAECGLEVPLVAVHPGTSDPKKRWPAERFREVCEKIVSGGVYRVVLIGGAEEQGESIAIARKMSPPIIDWTGRLTLPELAAFFRNRRVRALISSDSGPVHIAWMSGTPVVALYAKDAPGSNPVRWGPRDTKSVCVHKNMADITSEEVFAALKKVLESSP